MEKGKKRIAFGKTLIILQPVSIISSCIGSYMGYSQIGKKITLAQALAKIDFFSVALFIVLGLLLILWGKLASAKQELVAKQTQTAIDDIVDAIAAKAKPLIISLANDSRNIPSDNAVIAYLKQLTACADDYAVRQLAAHWMRANDKLKELKSILLKLKENDSDIVLLQNQADELAISTAKSFALFLCDFDIKLKNKSSEEGLQKLKDFLANTADMYSIEH